jgi:hypothetical protein
MNPVILVSCVVLTLASGFSAPTAQDECKTTHLVALGEYCALVPCDYRVVQVPRFPDALIGSVTPPEGGWHIDWSFGAWEDLLSPAETRKVIWTKSEKVAGRTFRVGLVEKDDNRLLVLAPSAKQQFTLSADTGSVPDPVEKGNGVTSC